MATAKNCEWDIVAIGSANIDHLGHAVKLPGRGRGVEGDKFQQAPGGKGANQAIAAARLGAHVALIASVGRDNGGNELLDRLTCEGVEKRFVERNTQIPTGTALIIVSSEGESETIFFTGANSNLTIEDVYEAQQALESTRLLLAQPGVPIDSLITAIRIARNADATIILDPSPPQSVTAELLEMVDIIKPNSYEAEVLTGIKIKDRDTARQAGLILRERGVAAAAIEVRNSGNLLIWPDGERWLPHYPVKSVDPTGAGDAFLAALAVALVEGRTFEAAGPFASAAAAFTTTAIGAQAALPRRNDILELIARSDPEKLIRCGKAA